MVTEAPDDRSVEDSNTSSDHSDDLNAGAASGFAPDVTIRDVSAHVSLIEILATAMPVANHHSEDRG